MTEVNPYKMAMKQIDVVAPYLDVDEGILEKLRYPRRELTVHCPVKMDDGSLKVFKGYRVTHNDTRGPAKGGLRYHPDVDLDEVKGHKEFMATACPGNQWLKGKNWKRLLRQEIVRHGTVQAQQGTSLPSRAAA